MAFTYASVWFPLVIGLVFLSVVKWMIENVYSARRTDRVEVIAYLLMMIIFTGGCFTSFYLSFSQITKIETQWTEKQK